MTMLAWALGGWELLVILVLMLLLFGGRLPEVARNLGRGVVEFKKGLRDVDNDVKKVGELEDKDKPKNP